MNLSKRVATAMLGALCAMSAHAAMQRPSLLLIAVDGLRPDAVLEAEQHGLKVPHLKAFLAQGAYATGVKGAFPSVVSTGAQTLMTGTSPASRGTDAQTDFDPMLRNGHGWDRDATDDESVTLWQAARTAHLKTANVYWPTSSGAGITYNLPGMKLSRGLTTPGLEQELSTGVGKYSGNAAESILDDEVRARFAMRLIELKHPDFTTVYLSGLDTEEHVSGPFSAKANAGLERLDAVIGQLRAAAERAAPGRATIAVVSDHGFAAVEHDVNLYAAFLEAGLFRVDANNKVLDWKAMPWARGGTAAIVLSDPKDAATRARVSELLEKLAGDPENGIERILTRSEIAQGHGLKNAEFVVAFRIGFEIGDRYELPLISAPSDLGMHGYLSERLEMRSAFFIVGPGVSAKHSVGEIDMREIAPTLAGVLHLSLKDAEMAPLRLR